MPRTLTIGSEEFLFPEQGEKAGWGEVVTDFAEAVADTLADVTNDTDIASQTVTLTDNTSSVANVGAGSSLLRFSTTAVRSFTVSYSAYRATGSGAAEVGTMSGVYDNAAWTFSVDKTGDVGLTFTITSAGQVQYTSSSLGYNREMKFSARTIQR